MYDVEQKLRALLCSGRSLSCQILVKHEFSHKIFENYSYISFHENTPTWSHIWHDEANSLLFAVFANAPKNDLPVLCPVQFIVHPLRILDW